MKIIVSFLSFVLLLTCSFVNAQVEITAGIGTSSYYGDLTENYHLFNQSSVSFNAGVNYQFSPRFSWRTELCYAKIQASDSKNNRADLRARNLSFQSNIWAFNTVTEYDFVNFAEHRCAPYVFVGLGLFHFNPYTTDRYGNKQYLQPLGTEGQGSPAYPDRLPYSLTQLEIPLGFGVKYSVNDRVIVGLEYKYNYTDTDYLDDVSMSGYPDPAVLAAMNPILPKLTYRGDELPGGQPYPSAKSGLNRGNPNKNDIFYSVQARVSYRLKGKALQINY